MALNQQYPKQAVIDLAEMEHNELAGAYRFAGNENDQPNTMQPQQSPFIGNLIVQSGSESSQVRRLVERCQMLEGFCRELLQTNKVLDLENRICISQITALNKQGGTQLDNYVGALDVILSKQAEIQNQRSKQKNTIKYG